MAKNTLEILEQEELIQKLIDAGYGELIDALLSNEKTAYTKKGKLNKSGACRILNCKPKDLENAFNKCKEILGNDTY